MNNYRKTKVDANQGEIYAYLRDNRVFVTDLSGAGGGVTDCWFCAPNAEMGFMEIKIEGSKAQYTRAQLEFIALMPPLCPVQIVKSKEDALDYAMNARARALTKKQRDRLAAFLKFNAGAKFQPSVIEKVLEAKS